MYEAYNAAFSLTGRGMAPSAFMMRIVEDPTPFYLLPRIATAVMGTATVPLLFDATCRLFDLRTGLIAAALLSAAFLHVRESHFGVTDVPATFMMIVAFWAIVRSDLSRHHPGRVLMAGVLCGLAASTKYNVALVVLPLVIRIVQRSWEEAGRFSDIVAACSIAAAGAVTGFIAGTPFALVDSGRFARDVASAGANLAAGHGADLGRGWTSHLSISLWYGLGAPMLAAAFAGAVWLTVSRPATAALVLAFPVSYYLVIGARRSVLLRYIDPVLPFGCMLAAVAISSFVRAAPGAHGARRRTALEPSSLRRRRNARRLLPRTGEFDTAGYTTARNTLAVVLTIVVAWPGVRRSVAFDRLLGQEDNRVRTAAWLESTFAAGTTLFQTGGSLYGRFQFTRPPKFAEWTWDDPGEGFHARGRAIAGWPQVVVVQRSPLKSYHALPDRMRALLQAKYRSIKTFFVETSAQGPPPVYDLQDAFFVPLDGFEHLSRPGPSFEVFERIENETLR